MIEEVRPQSYQNHQTATESELRFVGAHLFLLLSKMSFIKFNCAGETRRASDELNNVSDVCFQKLFLVISVLFISLSLLCCVSHDR